ncbi:hypothetical protein CBR_g21297 [Chara braunii]|uniref:Anaphase-promoting complex subunit 4 WD40 domain-containing protein n=1 Tax=Chara braunii TaxID=69332 RepID=A0A388L182_CHABU|nr:hypothetical protein CBR_g21297 [Chara braunii]|eukprot:GBG76057.1 hypothetical protein CBR_g21297 [Chara braunii]
MAGAAGGSPAMVIAGLDPPVFVAAAVGAVTLVLLVVLFVFRLPPGASSPSSSSSSLTSTKATSVDDDKPVRKQNTHATSAGSRKKAPTHSHSHWKASGGGAEKAQQHRHPLCFNTVKGHTDAVTGLHFSPDGRNLATACTDRVIRVFKVADITAKSFKFLRIDLPVGIMPVDVAVGGNASEVVVAGQILSGASLSLYAPASTAVSAAAGKGDDFKLPEPELKWEKRRVHDNRSIIKLSAASMTHGQHAKGGVIVATCSEGTDVKVWTIADGRCVGTVDSNQLCNHMAALSPSGRFLAAAAFTGDVKIWEVCTAKDGQVKEVARAMQLKGHKSAVTWLCFAHDSEKVVTASKDGKIKVWNINVRYELSEDPRCLHTFDIPENANQQKGGVHYFDKLALSPDDRILACTIGCTLCWLDMETGEVIDTAENAHDGHVSCLEWSPQRHNTGKGVNAMVLATGGPDRKVKLWDAPVRDPSRGAGKT